MKISADSVLDKKHIQFNWIYIQPSFTSSREGFFQKSIVLVFFIYGCQLSLKLGKRLTALKVRKIWQNLLIDDVLRALSPDQIRIHATHVKMLYFFSHFSKSLEEIYFIEFRSKKLRIRLVYYFNWSIDRSFYGLRKNINFAVLWFRKFSTDALSVNNVGGANTFGGFFMFWFNF